MNFGAQWKPSPPSFPGKRAGRPHRRWLAAGLAASLTLPAVIACSILGYRRLQRRASPTLGLQVVTRDAGQFLVSWDHQAPEILRARRGVLAIQDGSHEDHLELSPPQLRRGNLTYNSAGANIQFRMEVFRERRRSVVESIRVLKAADTGAAGTERLREPALANGAGTPTSSSPAAASGKRRAGKVIPATSQRSARTDRSPEAPRPAPIAARYQGPQVIQPVEPVIPAASRASLSPRVQIDVRVEIDKEGAVTDAQVKSGDRPLDPSLAFAAMRAARQFQFQPARANDRNVPSAMILSFRFVP